MKAQIDWIPLALGGVRPTQGKTLAIMKVSGSTKVLILSINCVFLGAGCA